MPDRKKKFYFDNISSIDLIEQFTIGVDLFAQYKLDKKTKSAVERQLSIIGEAIKKIKEIDPDEIISNRQILSVSGTGSFTLMIASTTKWFGLL